MCQLAMSVYSKQLPADIPLTWNVRQQLNQWTTISGLGGDDSLQGACPEEYIEGLT